MVDTADVVEGELEEITLTNDATEDSSAVAPLETRAADSISVAKVPSTKKKKVGRAGLRSTVSARLTVFLPSFPMKG